MQALDQATRTFNCSVVFVDLVGYAKKSVAEQIAARESLNRMLAETLGLIPDEGRIILETGDGAAMNFLDDPEDALYAGMALRQLASDALAEANGAAANVRIGINLGPVQIGQNEGGQTTIVGDGINTAEQIMGFAPPGQIAVSKSFYEKVSPLSDAYSHLFRYEGSRTDKHVRDHEIYQLGWSDEALEHVRASVAARRNPPPDSVPVLPAAAPAAATAPARGEPLGGLIDFLSDNTKVGFAAVILGAVIAAQGFLLYMKHAPESPVPPPVVAQAPVAEPPAPTSAPAPPQPPAQLPGQLPAQPAAPQKSEPGPAPRTPAPAAEPAKTIPSSAQPAKPAPAAPVPGKEPEKGAVKEPPAKATPAPVPVPLEPAAPAKTLPRKTEPEPAKPAVRKPDPEPKVAPRKTEPAKETKPGPSTVSPTSPAAPPVAPAATSPARQNGLLGGLVPLTRTSVDFPKEAVREGITSGTVKARLAIDAAGNVTQVDVLESRPARVFDRAVRGALVKWKFAPGADNRSYEIEIDFKK